HHEGKREMVNTSRIPSVSFTTSTSYDDLTTQGLQLTTTSQWLNGNNTVLGIEYQSDELDAEKYEVRNSVALTPSYPVPYYCHLTTDWWWSAAGPEWSG